MLLIFLIILFGSNEGLECFNCESDFQGTLRCQQPCDGDQCVVWKWKSRSEMSIKQGCLTGMDRQWTSKVGCRTNHLGASLCVCEDGPHCNRVERAEQASRPLPNIRLPAVECQSRIMSNGFFGGSRREKVCTSNYCHVTRTDTFIEKSSPEELSVADCGDIPEFDFDVRLKNSIGVPGLYPNGCYRIQIDRKSSSIDCVCSRNKCNEVLAEIDNGPVRCYMGKNFRNSSQIDVHEFCDGDFCFIQNTHGKVVKGCISVNERNSWSHLKTGYRKILGVDQWFCQAHLCNFDIERVLKSIKGSRRRNNSEVSGGPFRFANFISFIFIFLLL